MSDLDQLCKQATRERADFRAGKTTTSPACVELFRRAFANDPPAWEVIFGEVFAQDIKQYVQAAHREYIIHMGSAPFAIEDAEQETRMAFWRYAPKAATLLDSGLLEPIMVYLKKCAKSGAAQAARLNRHETVPLSSLAGEEEAQADETHSHAYKIQHAAEASFDTLLIERQELLDELHKLVKVDPEAEMAETVVIECFLNELPPRDLPDLHPKYFQEIGTVNTILQRIRRRAAKQPYFQQLLRPHTQIDP